MTIETSSISQLQKATDIFFETYKFANANAKNFLAMQAALEAVYLGPYIPPSAAALAAMRQALNAVLQAIGSSSDGDGGIVAPIIRYWGSGLTNPNVSPTTDIPTIAARIYDRLVASSQTIQSRQITRASPSAGGGNVGTGAMKRLNVGPDNFPLEGSYLDAEQAKVVADSNTGTERGQEVFQFRGTAANIDRLLVGGSGGLANIAAKNADNSYLTNPSFGQYDDATTPTTIDGWEPGSSIANFSIDTTNYYVGYGNDSADTHQSAVIKANDKLVQSIEDMAQEFNPGIPVWCQVAYNRSIGGADGTLTFKVGSRSVTANLGAAGAGWNLLTIGGDQYSWYQNLKQNDFTVEIGVTGGATFNCRIDDIRIVPYEFYNGTWWAPIGAVTPWLLNDIFTWTDALSTTEGKIMFMLFMLGLAGKSWPSAAVPTIADP